MKNSPKDKTLKDILSQHCQSPPRPEGLLLLTLPTGFGKTHYVLEYLAEHLHNDLPQKVWFVTNLKKNLPYEELREKIGEELFDRKVAVLQSYTDQMAGFFKDQDIPDALKPKFASYPGLHKAVKAYRRDGSNTELQDFLKEKLSKKETAFRKELKEYLSKLFKPRQKMEERLKVLRSDPNLRWVEKMYPSVLYSEKKVFFCTIDKFYLYLDTIIGPNFQLTNPRYIRNNIIFIDEFDATKANVKRAIIENAIRFSQDILGLFARIYYGVTNRQFPLFKLKDAEEKRIQSLEAKFRDIQAEAHSISGKYQLKSHFYHQGKAENNRVFLFHDFEYHIIYEKGDSPQEKAFLSRHFDKQDQTNYIRMEEERPKQDEDNLLFLLNDLRNFIHFFAHFASEAALLYKGVHDSESPEEIDVENAIRTILDWFDIRDAAAQQYFIHYISRQVLLQQANSSMRFDVSPVSQGFRYYDILNKKSHDATSKILFVDTITTPEAWLLNLCQNALVIGISATAGFDSPLSNYSLSHLKHHLKDRFFELDAAEKAILEEEFHRKNQHADRREMQLVPLASKAHKEPALKELFWDEEIVNHFLNHFSHASAFDVQRYVKVGMAYRHFIQHPEIHSFLALLNKLPKPDRHDSFQEEVLKELFRELRIQELGEDEETAREAVERELRVVKSQGFDEEIEELKQQLKEGHRIFLLSTYQTMGAGQNIQYETPEGFDPVAINDLDYGGRKKDFDAIYLEKPTYVLNWFPEGEKITEEQLLDYLFEVAYLAEGGAISRKEKRFRIRFGFRRMYKTYDKPPQNKDLKLTRAVAEHFCRTLIQAVGRLSRTRLKAPITHILYDEAIQDYLAYFNGDGYLLVPEFKALLDHCQGALWTAPSMRTEVENLNIQNSLALATLLRKLIRNIPNWRLDAIDFWENLREYVLKNPTASLSELERSGLGKFYIRHPEGESTGACFYESDDDFMNNLAIHFDKPKGKELSATGAMLPDLLRIPLVEDLFRENGYATNFTPNDYLLSPPLFQNIYLGALGEVIGKHILEAHGIPCSPLEQGEYELFDAKISDQIYVDFKHWSPGTQLDASVQKEKIRGKLDRRPHVRHVLIINLTRPDEHLRPVVGGDGIVEIPGLIDLEKGVIIGEHIQFIHQFIQENG